MWERSFVVLMGCLWLLTIAAVILPTRQGLRLTQGEQWYLWCTSLPSLFLALFWGPITILPAMGLSAVIVPIGVIVVWLRYRRGEPNNRRLLAGLALAGLPGISPFLLALFRTLR